MTYKVHITDDIQEMLRYLDGNSSSIIISNLKKLKEDSYPDRGSGDKEKLPVKGKLRYQMHIGRTWTVFYSVLEEEKQVRVSELIPIDEAHKKYGY
ncbi:MAG: type II toxin-antitoxin system RelE/ParE family toxin [Candidatus Thermoplasmatota archaeon]|nr:type II toxin-antitoxin system RelE/ParE family toxin [Candidatus Thermoplasmatota archaeon]